MKKQLGLLIVFALLVGMSAKAEEKKNMPKPEAVATELKAVGGEHYPAKMKVSKVGSVKVDETFYHAYSGSLNEGGYHVILVDNKGNYLGFYPCEFEPVDVEEGAVLLDSGNSDSEGNTTYFKVPVGKDGPADKIRVDGTPVAFVKVPKKDAKPGATENVSPTATAAAAGPIQPEYREWTITRGGKSIPARALYVKEASGKVFLKSEGNGMTASFSLQELSDADRDYLKLLEK